MAVYPNKFFLKNPRNLLSAFFLVFLLLENGWCQNSFGLISGNYAGINALKINPANICYQPVSLDVNLFGGSVTLANNSFYADPVNLVAQAFTRKASISSNNRNYEGRRENSDQILLNRDIQSNSWFFAGAELSGPGIMMATSSRSSIAFTTSLRNSSTVNNISAKSAISAFEGLNSKEINFQPMDLANSKMVFATWFEAGLSYAKVIKQNSSYLYRLGGTAKALFGLNGGYFYDRGLKAYNANRTLTLEGGDFSYAYSGNRVKGANPLIIRGMGAALDIGFSIQRKDRNHTRRVICPNLFNYAEVSCDYKWKLGFSLLDWGGIKYYKEAFTTDVDDAVVVWNKYDTLFAYGASDIDRSVKRNIPKKGQGTIHAQNEFWIIMPSAVSMQFDYKILSDLYCNFSIIQRVAISKAPWLARMNVASIAPRIELETFEISMPVTMYEYESAAVGLALRMKYLTIGSDRIAETFGLSKLYGADFYMAIKYNIAERCKKIKRYF